MSFNFNNYDNWLKKSKHTIFMSEYTMPFQKLIEINKRILLSQFNKDGKGEGLYINKPIKVKSDTQFTIFDYLWVKYLKQEKRYKVG